MQNDSINLSLHLPNIWFAALLSNNPHPIVYPFAPTPQPSTHHPTPLPSTHHPPPPPPKPQTLAPEGGFVR